MIFAPFAKLETAPPDPILGLTDAFRADPNPDKINLGVGVYLNDDGANTVLKAVKQAEKILLEEETTKNYLPIQGEPAFGKLTQTMLFGEGHPVLVQGRAASLQTPGGTGALRLGGDFLKAHFPGAVVWISDPTWPNHRGVFQAAGLKVATYPYYDPATSALR
ncbi:MAG: aminotransferase class I/II-fold pyridoxal phosphate-dependent enzyme, partial [Deltaproteobacteria bacterium]|nr:aminotransferase class I/II-fold pyridoxal phosphate-dependent enzyme [Deltaproteobacteria bacterium]